MFQVKTVSSEHRFKKLYTSDVASCNFFIIMISGLQVKREYPYVDVFLQFIFFAELETTQNFLMSSYISAPMLPSEKTEKPFSYSTPEDTGLHFYQKNSTIFSLLWSFLPEECEKLETFT